MVPLYKVLYDVRFPASVTFARRATAHGMPVHAMDGDMTRFWYDDLYHRWQRRPVAIAGLTAHGALFCLERLAWDQRMRVVFRAEHAAAPGTVTHTIEAPRKVRGRRRARPVGAMGERDGRFRAAVSGRASDDHEARRDHRRRDDDTGHAEPLFSWLIAPVARA